MKTLFEEPSIEITRFAIEDELTSSGVRTGFGMNSGFDEMEPDDYDDDLAWTICLLPPCA